MKKIRYWHIEVWPSDYLIKAATKKEAIEKAELCIEDYQDIGQVFEITEEEYKLFKGVKR